MGEAPTHVPVLLDEVVDALHPVGARVIVDGTFGRGGHARKLLEHLGLDARLLVFDKDPDAIAEADRLARSDPRVSVTRGSFAGLRKVVEGLGLLGSVDAVLLDLGVSSPQLDEPARGFSFQSDGPLDMRMDPESGPSAGEWLRRVSEGELADVLKTYGEERYARRIARAIKSEGEREALETTAQLAEIVARAVPASRRGKHPATRTFQALRIHLNRELEELEQGLDVATEVLAPGGRLAVISFHSLEDRMVKRFMRREARPDSGPFPVPVSIAQARLRVCGRALRPACAELAANPRARSAVLRVAERV